MINKIIKTNYKLLLGLFLVICLSFFAIKPFFHSGFFPVHDDTQVQRVFEMSQALRDGMFPVRWVNDLGYGYGYPIFNFYAPLPYYFGGILVLLGVNSLIATKVMFVFGIILSGIFMYLLARKLFGEIIAPLVALIYLYAPYHALNIYVRGDIGEIWSYAFIPIVFYALLSIYKNKRLIFAPILGISYALIILSHNLSAFMITPFIVFTLVIFFYSSFKKANFRVFNISLLGLILGILIAAFYLIPALFELKYTNVNSIIGLGSDFRNHFVCVSQFWSSPWGFGGSNPGCVDGLSFRLGKIQILAVILSLILFIPNLNILKKESKYLFAYFFLGLLVSIFLTLSISKPIWEILTPMKYIQFPWRFLALIGFFSSLLIGYLILNIKVFFSEKKIIYILALFILLSGIIFSSLKLFIPQKYLSYAAGYYTDLSNIRWTTSKISDEYMPASFLTPKSKRQIYESLLVENNFLHTVVTDSTQTKEIVGKFPESKVYVINTAYFPSWRAYINTKNIPIKDVNGKVGVFIEKGYQLIQLRFESTPAERFGNLFSFIGIIGTFAVIILGIKQKDEKNT